MTNKEIYNLIKKECSKVVTDSRHIENGDIFFALSGDTYDGNAFAEEAISKGAIASVIDNKEYFSEGCILTDNVLRSLQEIANIHRKNFKIPVLAITGTNGKTTTKELLSKVLSKKYSVHSTTGNLNNHIGVPLTLLDAPEKTDIIIIEMGANHRGEISMLCEIAEPDYGLVTNIGKAHLEGFGSFEGVVEAKSELYNYLSNVQATVFYNDDNKLLCEIIKDLKSVNIPYSNPGLYFSIDNIEGNETIEFNLNISGNRSFVKTQLFGSHNIENIKAAIAIGIYFKIDISRIIEALQKYSPDNNRSQVVETSSNTLLCDAYNANPDSMLNALDSFISTKRERKSVILGDMFELGEYSFKEHKRIVSSLTSVADIDVYLVGEQFMKAARGTELKVFLNVQLLMEHLESFPIRNSFVLLKGSRGIFLEKVFPLL